VADRTSHTDSAFPYSVPKLNDGSQGGLSKREYAAILLKVPDSGTDWLDVMIRRAHEMMAPMSFTTKVER
jgi:hypothetical protein